MNIKSVLLYSLVFVLSLVLSNRKCTGDVIIPAPNVTDTITVRDTVYSFMDRERTKTVTIRDTVIAREFVLKDTVMILYSDRDEYPDSMKVWGGSVAGQRCSYDYLAGLWRDSIQFLQINSQCEQEEPLIIIQEPEAQPPDKPQWGFTAAWSPMHPRLPAIGTHLRFNHFYVGSEYAINGEAFWLRAGWFFNKK